MGQPTSQLEPYCSDNGLDHEDSGLEDLTQEEGKSYESFDELDLWLLEAPPSENVAASIEEVPSELPTHLPRIMNTGLTLLQKALRMATPNLQLQKKSTITFGDILSSRSRWLYLRNRSEDNSSGMYMITLEALGSRKLRRGDMCLRQESSVGRNNLVAIVLRLKVRSMTLRGSWSVVGVWRNQWQRLWLYIYQRAK